MKQIEFRVRFRLAGKETQTTVDSYKTEGEALARLNKMVRIASDLQAAWVVQITTEPTGEAWRLKGAAFTEGFQDAVCGEPYENPHKPGTWSNTDYREGFQEGRAVE